MKFTTPQAHPKCGAWSPGAFFQHNLLAPIPISNLPRSRWSTWWREIFPSDIFTAVIFFSRLQPRFDLPFSSTSVEGQTMLTISNLFIKYRSFTGLQHSRAKPIWITSYGTLKWSRNHWTQNLVNWIWSLPHSLTEQFGEHFTHIFV